MSVTEAETQATVENECCSACIFWILWDIDGIESAESQSQYGVGDRQQLGAKIVGALVEELDISLPKISFRTRVERARPFLIVRWILRRQKYKRFSLQKNLNSQGRTTQRFFFLAQRLRFCVTFSGQ
jgi:hypothetical protein